MLFKLVIFPLLIQFYLSYKIITLKNEIYNTFPTQNIKFPNDIIIHKETYNTFYSVSIFGPVPPESIINHNKTIIRRTQKPYECYRITSDINIGELTVYNYSYFLTIDRNYFELSGISLIIIKNEFVKQRLKYIVTE